jgi:2'-5' RNA ligase
MRLFIGVDLPAPRLDELPAPRDASPSHLTLVFLGEVEDRRIPGLEERCRTAVLREPPFTVELRGLGVFPNPARPRILWAGVGEGATELTRLAAALREAAGPLAPSEDRPFIPHLTVLRVRGTHDAERARAALERAGTQAFSVTPVAEVVLKASELGREGATHRVIARFPLQGAPTAGGMV